MKIGQPPEIPPSMSPGSTAAAQKAAQQPATATAAANANASKSTRAAGVAVTVSTLAQTLEKSDAAQPGDIDTQKVASVRSSIENGTYVVNPEAIADKLLSNAQDMLNRTTR